VENGEAEQGQKKHNCATHLTVPLRPGGEDIFVKSSERATFTNVLAFLRAKIMKAQSAPLQKARLFYISQKREFVKLIF